MCIFSEKNAVLFWKCKVERDFEKSISNISSDFTFFFDPFKIFISYYFDIPIIYKLDTDLQIFAQFRIVSQIFTDR